MKKIKMRAIDPKEEGSGWYLFELAELVQGFGKPGAAGIDAMVRLKHLLLERVICDEGETPESVLRQLSLQEMGDVARELLKAEMVVDPTNGSPSSEPPPAVEQQPSLNGWTPY